MLAQPVPQASGKGEPALEEDEAAFEEEDEAAFLTDVADDIEDAVFSNPEDPPDADPVWVRPAQSQGNV